MVLDSLVLQQSDLTRSEQLELLVFLQQLLLVCTTNMVVGDRDGTGYSEYYDPNVQVFPDVTFVTGIGVYIWN